MLYRPSLCASVQLAYGGPACAAGAMVTPIPRQAAIVAIAATKIRRRAYAFLVPTTVQGVSQSQVEDLRHNQIEPALRNGDWSGAAVAAANGLDSAAG